MTLEILTTGSHEYKFKALDFGTLHFSVQASNDAQIILSSTNANKPPKYEIIIGGWKSSKSAIIKNNEKPECAIVCTPQILSSNEARGFWIKWGGGYIDVGKQGQVKPFMSWQDDNEICNIAYFGVRTNWGATGVWTIEGRWKNTASARYNKELPDKVHVDTPQLLSKSTPSKFTIFWKNGLIELFWDYTKLFEWINPKPFNISYYGVRTCKGATGNWCIYGTADERFRSKVVPTKSLNVQDLCSNCNSTWLKANNSEVLLRTLSSGHTKESMQLFVGRSEHDGTVTVGKTKQYEKELNEPILEFLKKMYSK